MADDHATAASSTGPTRDLRLVTSDGVSLEAELAWPVDARAGVVLAHPHPLHGGSMRSLVTSELFRALPTHGIAVLRFNFRGVEGSEGEHGGGIDERLDVEAALDVLCAHSEALPVLLAGWSFGADVVLTVVDRRPEGWFLIAPTLRTFSAEAYVAGVDPRPKLLAVPEHDAYRPPESAREATQSWRNTTIDVIPGADHFLVGRTAKAADLLVDFTTRFAG